MNDQFGRKISVYAKGKLGKLDYRLAVGYTAVIGTNAIFSGRPPKAQYQGYFQYQIKDQESNLVPYTAGIYLGKKTVFNIGAGFIVQPQAV